MRLYDSLKQDKREFVPRDGDHVTMYFCGPTVYNYIHLGNARPYVLGMVAKRYFESLGWRVTLAVNITDIDDRIINKAIAEGKDYLREAPHICLFPGIAVALICLGLNLLGDGLRDVLDPRLRVQIG